eukprot:CAMPEP_0175099884 /NCGR_PEP_ID=MMETSP0086_2-20121207/6724_1 /TAXON_ID=136419 /ORGANISM="Unknown Unknown, Strain D1" /LENGTH=334 /DNA_ID=CAMNT_0016373823 /DNA_START=34 /DNA_END=1038 /DNA_ORIENTATION=+
MGGCVSSSTTTQIITHGPGDISVTGHKKTEDIKYNRDVRYWSVASTELSPSTDDDFPRKHKNSCSSSSVGSSNSSSIVDSDGTHRSFKATFNQLKTYFDPKYARINGHTFRKPEEEMFLKSSSAAVETRTDGKVWSRAQQSVSAQKGEIVKKAFGSPSNFFQQPSPYHIEPYTRVPRTRVLRPVQTPPIAPTGTHSNRTQNARRSGAGCADGARTQMKMPSGRQRRLQRPRNQNVATPQKPNSDTGLGPLVFPGTRSLPWQIPSLDVDFRTRLKEDEKASDKWLKILELDRLSNMTIDIDADAGTALAGTAVDLDKSNQHRQFQISSSCVPQVL